MNNASTSSSSSSNHHAQSQAMNGFNLAGLIVPSSPSTGFEIDELLTSPAKEVVNGNLNGNDKGKGREIDLNHDRMDNSRGVINGKL